MLGLNWLFEESEPIMKQFYDLCFQFRIATLWGTFVIVATTPRASYAQQYIDLEKNQRQQQLNQAVQQYKEKKERWQNRNGVSLSAPQSGVESGAVERELSNAWQIKSIRYTCANGVSLESNQRTASAELLFQLQERIEKRTPTSSTITLSKSKLEELDALDEIDSNMRSEKPITLTLKHKRYELKLERGALGWHYINRGQGVVWTIRGGKGTLKNAFSGRILAHDCKAGTSLTTDSQTVSQEDDLIAKLKKP
jgi:hypothetical protein